MSSIHWEVDYVRGEAAVAGSGLVLTEVFASFAELALFMDIGTWLIPRLLRFPVAFAPMTFVFESYFYLETAADGVGLFLSFLALTSLLVAFSSNSLYSMSPIDRSWSALAPPEVAPPENLGLLPWFWTAGENDSQMLRKCSSISLRSLWLLPLYWLS